MEKALHVKSVNPNEILLRCRKPFILLFLPAQALKWSMEERKNKKKALLQQLNKRERIGTALQHQRIQPRKHTIIITMRGVVWLILSDWPQVPVLSPHRCSQRRKESPVLFRSPAPVNGEKKKTWNPVIYIKLQVNWFRHAMQHSSYNCSHHCCSTVVILIFTQIRHAEDDELSCFLSSCLCFYFFNDCRVMQTSLDDVQQSLEEGRGWAEEEPITLWCTSRWRQEYFFYMTDVMLKHQQI